MLEQRSLHLYSPPWHGTRTCFLRAIMVLSRIKSEQIKKNKNPREGDQL
jgi:hypothetical protein